ncbi:MAG: aldo/keto reductase [Actinomycetota bacterium]
MRHTSFGRTGMAVSRLCLGTMTFGIQNTPEESFAILDQAMDHEITFMDTANVYPAAGGIETAGRTEEIIGDWMQARGCRDDVVLATKCVGVMGPRRWQRGASRKHIMDAVDDSLRRLKTDWIDVYQMHGYDPRTPIDETLSALDDLVRSGKVRYLGCSNYSAWQLARANGVAAAESLRRFDCVQPRYNLLFRTYEQDLFELCGLDDIAVIPYNPIAGGMLSGKHSQAAGPTEGTRFAIGNAGVRYQARYWKDAEFATVEDLRPVAGDLGVSMVTLANAWVLANPVITSPIVGASKPEQLADAVAALDVTLDDEVMARLDELTTHYRDIPLSMG